MGERSGFHGDGAVSVDEYYDVVAWWLDRSLQQRGDVAWWCDRMRACGSGPVLELGCGTGRVTARLAETGRDVIGLDRSEAMLAKAKGRLVPRAGDVGHGARPGQRRKVRLIRGDLRNLPVRDASIRCIVAPADPLIHLTADADRQRAIDEAGRILAPGGRLVLEFLWWTPPEQARARSANGLEHHRVVVGADGDAVEMHERWLESDGGAVRGTYRYCVRGEEASEASFSGRRWSREELDRRLRRAGLEVVTSWGGFDGQPFDPNTARALLVEARAANAD